MLDLIDFTSYLDHVRADGERLILVARDCLDAPVPPCPGWTVQDLVTHVAEVYEHKLACTLLQRQPDPWPPQWAAQRDPLEWFVDAHQRLLALFTECGPLAPSHTWWPGDQTVGFWARRMAQETVIHRIDAELSCGQSSPIAPELAVDGVDEVLVVFLAGDWSEAPFDECQGQSVVVRTGGRAWEVQLLRGAVSVSQPHGGEVAEVSGEPAAVLLWLWGRGPLRELRHSGDSAVPALLRDRLRLATQ